MFPATVGQEHLVYSLLMVNKMDYKKDCRSDNPFFVDAPNGAFAVITIMVKAVEVMHFLYV